MDIFLEKYRGLCYNITKNPEVVIYFSLFFREMKRRRKRKRKQFRWAEEICIKRPALFPTLAIVTENKRIPIFYDVSIDDQESPAFISFYFLLFRFFGSVKLGSRELDVTNNTECAQSGIEWNLM